jgi:hypothetical protein
MIFDVYSAVLLHLMKPSNPTNVIVMSVQLYLHVANVDADVFRAKVMVLMTLPHE